MSMLSPTDKQLRLIKNRCFKVKLLFNYGRRGEVINILTNYRLSVVLQIIYGIDIIHLYLKHSSKVRFIKWS